jgi:hypothetical protein
MGVMVVTALLWTLILQGGTPPPQQPPPPPPPNNPGGSLFLPPLPAPKPHPDPPKPPPPLPQSRACDCLTWDKYNSHPRLSHFRILVSETKGAFTDEDERARVPAVQEKLITEVSCEQLHLFANGRYYAVVQAVAINGTREGKHQTDLDSKYSNEVCLEVRDRQVYSCSTVNGSSCQGS